MSTTPNIAWDDEQQTAASQIQWDETPAQTANDELAKQGLSVSEPMVPNPEAGPAKPPATVQPAPTVKLTKPQADSAIAATDLRPRQQQYGQGGRMTIGTPPPRSIVSGLVTEQAERAKGAGGYRIEDRDALATPFQRNPIPAPVESVTPQGQPNIDVAVPRDQRLTKMRYENSISPAGDIFTAGETDVRRPEERAPAKLTPQEEEALPGQIMSPENMANAIYPGAGTMASSAGNVARGEFSTAAAKFLGGAGEALSPLIGPDAMEIARGGELARAIWLGVTMAGGHGADLAVRKVGQQRGWSPERIEAASQAAQWLVPGILSLTHGVARRAAELTPSAQNARAHADLVNAVTDHVLNVIGIDNPDVLQYNAARGYAEKVVAENFGEAGTAIEKYKAAINKREAAKRVRAATENLPPIEKPQNNEKSAASGGKAKPSEESSLTTTKPTIQPRATDITWDDEPTIPVGDRYEQAKNLVSNAGKASTTMLQRKLKIGYAEASKLVDRMQQEGLISKDRVWLGTRANEGQKPGQRPIVQGSANPREIRQSAEQQKPKIDEMAQAAIAGVKGGMVEGSRVKDAQSQHNKDERGKPAATNIDNLGARVSGETPDAIEQIKNNIEQKLPVVGHEKITTNGLDADQYAIQTGKPGDANQVSEIQVINKPQADALKKTDDLYNQQKEALARGDQEEADRIGERIKQVHQKAKQEFGQLNTEEIKQELEAITRHAAVTQDEHNSGDYSAAKQRYKESVQRAEKLLANIPDQQLLELMSGTNARAIQYGTEQLAPNDDRGANDWAAIEYMRRHPDEVERNKKEYTEYQRARAQVGSAETAKADTDFFQQAKRELGPSASISDVLKRAEDIKRRENGTPQYVYRSRDVGEQGVPSQSHSQATVSKQEAERYLASRGNTTGREQELVRIDLSKLPPDSYERKPGPNGNDWIKFTRDLPESAVERVHQLLESQGASPESHKFIDKAVEKSNNSSSEERGPATTDRGLQEAAGKGQADSDRGIGVSRTAQGHQPSNLASHANLEEELGPTSSAKELSEKIARARGEKIESSSVLPSNGAGDKSAQPKETPAGASVQDLARTVVDSHVAANPHMRRGEIFLFNKDISDAIRRAGLDPQTPGLKKAVRDEVERRNTTRLSQAEDESLGPYMDNARKGLDRGDYESEAEYEQAVREEAKNLRDEDVAAKEAEREGKHQEELGPYKAAARLRNPYDGSDMSRSEYEREIERIAERDFASGRPPGQQPEQYMDEQQNAVEKLLKDHGIQYSVKGDGSYSRYITFDTPDGEHSHTIRISDHPQPTKVGIRGGAHIVGGFNERSGERYEASDLSIHPGGDTVDDVRKLLGESSTPPSLAGTKTDVNGEAASKPKYEHGSTQVNIPDGSEAAKALDTARQRISDSDLAGDGRDVGGNHVTVRYGLDGDVEKVRQYLEKQAPFEARLGKTDTFPPSEHSDGAAVIFAPVEAPELHRINKEIAEHGQFVESSFPQYKPHATVAYVKPDRANRYVGMDVTDGKSFHVDSIAISGRDGKQEVVELKGKDASTGKPIAPAQVKLPEGWKTRSYAVHKGRSKVQRWLVDDETGASVTSGYDSEQAAIKAASDLYNRPIPGGLKRGQELNLDGQTVTVQRDASVTMMNAMPGPNGWRVGGFGGSRTEMVMVRYPDGTQRPVALSVIEKQNPGLMPVKPSSLKAGDRVESEGKLAKEEHSAEPISHEVLRESGKLSSEKATILRRNSQPLKDIHNNPTGWLYTENNDGATLVHPTEDRYVMFSPKDNRSGTALQKARAEAQAYAQDNPVVRQEQKPSGELIVKPIRQPAGKITVDEARKMGAKAFADGNKNVPANDQVLMKAIREIPADERNLATIALYDAWTKGWNEAYLHASPESADAESIIKKKRGMNLVVRDVRDFEGHSIAVLTEPYDGTESGAIEAARRVSERMFREYPRASNIESRIGATDEQGNPKWAISPNFRSISEVGTKDAAYTWGDLSAGEKPENPNTPQWYHRLEQHIKTWEDEPTAAESPKITAADTTKTETDEHVLTRENYEDLKKHVWEPALNEENGGRILSFNEWRDKYKAYLEKPGADLTAQSFGLHYAEGTGPAWHEAHQKRVQQDVVSTEPFSLEAQTTLSDQKLFENSLEKAKEQESEMPALDAFVRLLKLRDVKGGDGVRTTSLEETVNSALGDILSKSEDWRGILSGLRKELPTITITDDQDGQNLANIARQFLKGNELKDALDNIADQMRDPSLIGVKSGPEPYEPKIGDRVEYIGDIEGYKGKPLRVNFLRGSRARVTDMATGDQLGWVSLSDLKPTTLRTKEEHRTSEDAALESMPEWKGSHKPQVEEVLPTEIADQMRDEAKPVTNSDWLVLPHSPNTLIHSTEPWMVEFKDQQGQPSAHERALAFAITNSEGAAEMPLAPTKPLSVSAGPIDGLINDVYQKLSNGEALGNVTELNRLADQHLGQGWRTAGDYSPKDVFDAMEAGVNKWIIDNGKRLMEMPAEHALGELKQFEQRLTSQGTRTEEQITHQQFSTPPRESYVAARVAAIKPSDIVVEPSAGNGGLAAWPKSIGADVHVNEISPRRQKMLEAAGFGKPTAYDGEIINSYMGHTLRPTVVVMNPPFSAKAAVAGIGKNRNQYGFNHVDSALQMLGPNGRLVAILGGGQANDPEGGANLTKGSSGEWFKRISKLYNVRANVRVSGKEYQKYGTNFATRIIVIDKTGPTPDIRNVIQGNVDTLEEAYNLLRPVADSRPQVTGGDNVGPSNVGSPTRAGQGETGGSLVTDTSAGVPSVPSGTRTGGQVNGRVPTASGSNGAGPAPATSGSDNGPQQSAVHQQQDQFQRPAENPSPGGTGGSTPNDNQKRQVPGGSLDLEEVAATSRREEEDESGSSYTVYRPAIKGGQHPGLIVETKAMATVPMPPLNYRPSLPETVLGKSPNYDNAKLSAIQMEAVAVAGMQNDIILPGGYRAAALIGDGTGVGKGREGAGILLDNWNKGRRRLVWVSKSKALMEATRRDLDALGAHELAKNLLDLGKLKGDATIQHEGVVFTTYSLFRSADKKGNSRAAQLEKWLRGNDNAEGGYVLFDESHLLKNAVVVKGQEASDIGQTVKKFLQKMPNLRTAQMSATAASDVRNLGYLDRLGLWGQGTPFPGGFDQFASEIAHGGMSAMEMIARELKAQGKYISRTLSYRGIKYDILKHEITPEQEKIYESACDAWRAISQSIEHTISMTTNGGPRQTAMAMSQFYSTQQRFFSLLLTSMKIPSVVEAVQRDLANGKSVAITLINTNEAAQNREKNRIALDDTDEEPDYDFGPGRLLKDMVMEHYPVQQWEDSVDSNGNPIKVPVYEKDADGNNTNIPVLNPEAVRARDELIARLERELHMPSNPLDELIDQLGGPSKVAELTGRKQRFDPTRNRLVNRAGDGISQSKVNLAEMDAYQSGRKRIAVLSSAADTGISLHSDLGAKNQQQRIVYTLQTGWSADKALQMAPGRFHRTNQANAPEIRLVQSNLGGESRFISSLARRMEGLEALSKGQTRTNSGTEAMSKVNFETEQGEAASVNFYNNLLRNQVVPGAVNEKGEPLRGMEVLDQLGVLVAQNGGGQTVPQRDRRNVKRLLNRLLALKPRIQNAVYDYFYDIFEAVVQQAIDEGRLDTGVKRIPGDSFHVREFRHIASDPATGAKTFYYPVEAQERIDRMPVQKFQDMLDRADRQEAHPIIMRDSKGNLVLTTDARPIVAADGSLTEARYVMRPANGIPTKVPEREMQNWTAVDQSARTKKKQAERAWEQAHNDFEYYEREYKQAKEAEKNGGTRYGSDPAYYKQYMDRAKAKMADARKQINDARAEIDKRDYLPSVREEWQQQYEAAPAHKTVEHHLIGGAVMRYWNAIREATGQRLDVYSTVDDRTGQRVVGVEIPKEQIQRVLRRITGGASTITTSQIVPDVLNNGMQYDLEGGIKVRRGRVARQNVVQFVTSNPNTLKDLKDMGVLHEIGIQPIYYLPTDSSKARTVMDKILERYPVKPEEGKGVQPNALASTSGGSKEDASKGNHGPVLEEETALGEPGRTDRNKSAPGEGDSDELRAQGGSRYSGGFGQGEESGDLAPQATAKGLKTGDHIVFTEVPQGEYMRPGEVYRIESSDKHTLYLRDIKTNAGTSVRRAMLAYGKFRKVEPSESEGGVVLSANPLFDPRNWKKVGKAYDTAIDRFIDRGLKIGDKYYQVAEHDPSVADNLHLLDNAPRYLREKALANLKSVTDGLSRDQIRLAALMADSDSRDYLQEHHPDEYRKAINDPDIMGALRKFEPLQDELADDRVALGWPVRMNIQVEEDDTVNEGQIGRWKVNDRDGNTVAEFEKQRDALRFVEDNGIIEPHLKRTYPEHLRQPLPFQTAEQGQGPWTGSFYREPGVRPPRMDRKAREASAEYHYKRGAHDFSGYIESYRRVKEGLLKQNIYDDFTDRATPWKVGTAQPPQITYNGKTYYRPDIALKMRVGGEKHVPEYSVYDPTRGERFLVSTPEFSVITTGKPGITAKDRWLAPKPVVDGLEQYDGSRGGSGGGKLKRFFQEQIVGFYGPMVHVNNIIRRIGQATGSGSFDPRSWVSIAKVIASGELRDRVMQGVNDDTIDMLTRYGAYTDWRDIGNLNHYIGGNLNPFNWVRAWGKGVLFDPKFANGWGGLDPKSRVILADYLKDHAPEMTDQQIATVVEDAFGNYNRANWTERQRLLAKFTLFPGWDTASAKWFMRHPFKVAIAPAVLVLLANLIMNMLGKNKDQDKYDFSYLHYGDRRWRWGAVTDSFGLKLGRPVLDPMRRALEGGDSREVTSAIGQGFVDAGVGLASYLRPDIMGMAEVASNRDVLGRTKEIWNPGDEYEPGKVLPNRKLDKIVAHTVIRSFPAVSRWLAADQSLDIETGLTSIAGLTTYPYGAEQRLRENEAKARGYSVMIDKLAATDPSAAEEMAQDPDKAAYLMFHGDLTQMIKDLNDIQTQSIHVRQANGLSPDEKRAALDSLDEARAQVLKSADALNDQVFNAKREARQPARARGIELLNLLNRANGQIEAP